MVPVSASDGCLLEHKNDENAEAFVIRGWLPLLPFPRAGRASLYLHFAGWPKKIVGPKRQPI